MRNSANRKSITLNPSLKRQWNTNGPASSALRNAYYPGWSITYVVLTPGTDLSKRARRSSNVSCANCGSSLTSIRYREIMSERTAMHSVSENLPKVIELEGDIGARLETDFLPIHARAPIKSYQIRQTNKPRKETNLRWMAKMHL